MTNLNLFFSLIKLAILLKGTFKGFDNYLNLTY